MGKVLDLFKGGSKMATVFDVANYFLARTELSSGSCITPLKLQKLVYYAQAWSLAWDNKPLFSQEFEAWAYGPVNPELYDKYKKYGWNSIPNEEIIDVSVFNQEQIETLDAVWEGYGMYDGKHLEDLTHQEDPWINAREGFRPGERCTNRITKEAMKMYFQRMLNGEEN